MRFVFLEICSNTFLCQIWCNLIKIANSTMQGMNAFPMQDRVCAACFNFEKVVNFAGLTKVAHCATERSITFSPSIIVRHMR